MGIKNATYEERQHSVHVFGTPTRVEITSLTIALGLLDSRTEDLIWDARIHYMAAPHPNMLAGHIVEAMDADDLLPQPNQP